MTGLLLPSRMSLGRYTCDDAYDRKECIAKQRSVRDASSQGDANNREQRDKLPEPLAERRHLDALVGRQAGFSTIRFQADSRSSRTETP